jgi:glycosyltransferase involved in cell wall biosynthesis
MTQIPSVSIIVPARDEAGTIREIARRIPVMGKMTEIIFVEGFSTDKTWQGILELKRQFSRKNMRVIAIRQGNKKGKAAAVEQGFLRASGDILMILDADLSVDPESLPRFYQKISRSPKKFINGSRFIFPQEPFAMRYLNNIGNICFAYLFSILFRQKISDTLCGTKVIWKKEWLKMKEITKPFAKYDPYGDFELFLGAFLLHLEVIEVPVVYRARTYGKTKISRFRDGFHLLFVLFAFILFILRRALS